MLNQYSLALAITSVTYVVLAAFIFFQGPNKLTTATYSLYSIAIAWWSGLEAFSIRVADAPTALALWRLSHAGVILIPVFFVHFVTSLLEDSERALWKPAIFLSYVAGLFFLFSDATGFLIAGVMPRFSFRQFILPGPFYPWFFGIWLAWSVCGLALLFHVYRRSSGERRDQLRCFCWSMLAAYLGGAPNFLPTFKIEVPVLMPFGTYAVPLCALVTTYAIARYRLLNIHLALSRAAVFIGLYALLVGVPLLRLATPISNASIPPLAIALIFLTLGISVWLQSPASSTNRVFLLNCLTTILWQGGWTCLFSTTDSALADRLIHIGYSGIIFIPITFYHLVVNFSGLERERRVVALSYAAGAVFLALLWTTPWFIAGKSHYAWGYYPTAGVLHPVYLMLLTASATRIFIILWGQLRAGRLSPLRQHQARYTLLAIAAYTFASVDFLDNYGAGFYPFGFVFTVVSAAIITYAVVRYRLMEVNLAVTRTAVFMMVYTMVLGVPLLAALVWQPRLGPSLGRMGWIWLWIVCAMLTTIAHYANLYVQRFAERRLLAEQRRYQMILRQAAQGMTLIKEMGRLLDWNAPRLNWT